MMTFQQTIEYLDNFTNYERSGFEHIEDDFDLRKLKRALKEMGNPQDRYRSVHVAGTKGKGSVSNFIAAITREHGLRTGLFTSPHLESPLERISVDGEDICPSEFVHAVEFVRSMTRPPAEEEFTYFEMYALIAMVYFSMRDVDIAVFETGLGGRLDATNVIEPEVSVLTPVSYDHTEVLGDTIEEIAIEKCGIIKSGTKCVTCAQRPEVMQVIRDTARRLSAPLEVMGENITFSIKGFGRDGSTFDVHTPRNSYPACHTTMLGRFQAANAALAVAASESVIPRRRISAEAVGKAISKVHVPGRMELIAYDPLIVLDGAQNADSAASLARGIKDAFPGRKIVLIAGLSRGKDAEGFMEHLEPVSDRIVLTRSSSQRAMDPNVLRGYIKRSRCDVTGEAKEALGIAFTRTAPGGLILVCGSFYLVSEIKKLLRAERERKCPTGTSVF